MSKSCKICSKSKENTDFYPIRESVNTLNICKICRCEQTRAYRLANVDRYRLLDNKRDRSLARRKMHQRHDSIVRGRGTQLNKAALSVRAAINRGDLVRPDKCSRCHKACKPHGHHDDHTQLLKVVWLCPICHAQRHKELGRLKTPKLAQN